MANTNHNILDLAWDCVTRGELARAESLCKKALSMQQGGASQIWTMLGITLREQGKFKEAENAYRRAIVLSRNDAHAHHNLGALLSSQDRPEEALTFLNRAHFLGLSAPELHINLGRTLLQLYRLDDAERAYVHAVSKNSLDSVAQSMLAQLRYMRGDQEFARDLLTAAHGNPNHSALQLALTELQWRSGDFPGAKATLLAMLARGDEAEEITLALGRVCLEAGEPLEALRQAERLLRLVPRNAKATDLLVSAQLSNGRAEQALAHISVQRHLDSQNQRWIAYEATAERMLGRAKYRSLYDYGGFVRKYQIEVPKGWNSMRAFHESLAQSLYSRQVFKLPPLDQSLRNGGQTARNLLTDQDPPIQALLAAFVTPIQEYARTIDVAPDHPLYIERADKIHLSGCWSVQLHEKGFHVNHIHPQGRISSAYYVDVPDSVADAQRKSGWLKFGEPGIPVQGLTAEFFVRPEPGTLVLFPSYMWHGTNPILSGDRRLSVAFDVISETP